MTKGTQVALKQTREFLQKPAVLDQLQQAAVKGMDVRRLVKTALNTAIKNPRLLECTQVSWAMALQQSAELGIEPGPLGHAYLIPYKNKGTMEVQFMLGARGMVNLARRSDDIANVRAHVVRDGDEFEVELGLTPKIRHIPRADSEARPLLFAYAVAEWTNGATPMFEVMNRAEIDAIRSRSKSPNDGPWKTDYDEMAKKTVLRRLCKQLPMQIQAVDAIERDDQVSGLDLSTARAMDDLERELVGKTEIVDGAVVDTETGEVSEGDESQPGLEF